MSESGQTDGFERAATGTTETIIPFLKKIKMKKQVAGAELISLQLSVLVLFLPEIYVTE